MRVDNPANRCFQHPSRLESSVAWDWLCLFREPDVEKALSHWLQANCFSPVWESMCFFRILDLKKVLSYWEQTNSFSPVCERLCVLRLSD